MALSLPECVLFTCCDLDIVSVLPGNLMTVLVMGGMESLLDSDYHTSRAVYFFSEDLKWFAEDPHQANSPQTLFLSQS